MRFENPEIEDGINVSKEHPLKEFSQLLIGLLVIIVVAVLVLSYSVGYFAQKIPFSYEEKLVSHIDALNVEESAQQKKLQALADRLSAKMDLPEGMKITVHYSNDATVNAFATMGGHVFFFKGLIEKLPSENALAMVMAHEIAHIKHRHPVVAMGKGVTMLTLASFVTGASGSGAGELLINESMTLGLMKFSRDQESQSDLTAVHALNAVYGNVQGAKELFDVFSELSDGAKKANKTTANEYEIFLSHPRTENRWEKLRDYSQQRGWNLKGETTALDFRF